jgi:hypothetical protein
MTRNDINSGKRVGEREEKHKKFVKWNPTKKEPNKKYEEIEV